MDRTADLNSALSFVIGRIGEQATLSAEPLSQEQRMLLNYLPSSTAEGWVSDVNPVPRNLDYEQVCALGKAAYISDRQVNPASLDWEFAFAVFTLNRHPMWGLLQQVGLKHRRPLRDQLLLIVTALLPVMALILLPWNTPRTSFRFVGIGSGCVAIMLLIFFASRRIEERQLEKEIERCRIASHFIGTVAG